MATLNIEYERIKKDGSRATRIILSHCGSKAHIPTYIDLEADEYKVDKNGKCKVVSITKKTYLDEMVCKLNISISRVLREYIGLKMTASDLLALAVRPDKESAKLDNFITFAEKYIAGANIKGERNYRSMINSLKRYAQSDIVRFCDLTVDFLKGYLIYLKDKPRAQTLYLGALRHVYKQACIEYNQYDEILLSPSLFDRFKVPKQKSKGQRALDIDTILKVFACKPETKREELAIDCCMLSFCLMGTNSADLYHADRYNNGILAYNRVKTRDRRDDEAYIEINVPNIILPLIDKYKASKSSTGKVLSFAERFSDEAQLNRSINLGLKSIALKLGIQTLQFYQFRHSWASIARNDCQIDAYTVDKALNHKNRALAMLDIYVKRDFRAINEANAKVVEYVFKSVNKYDIDTTKIAK